ncbi:MAG: hypothetical protein ABJO86_00770 [Lentilitoribacter sp.]
MTLRNPKRLVPRDVTRTSVTKARPADAAATNNIAGLEQDTCECGSVPANEAFSRHAPVSRRQKRLAGHGKQEGTTRGRSSQLATPDSGEHACSSGSFFACHVNGLGYWICEEDCSAMAAIESADDFRKLELKGRF